jgi:hypothetical protein
MKAWPRWTKDEIRRLRQLAALGFGSRQIAQVLGRTMGATGGKATQLGIRISKRQRDYHGSAPEDRSIWGDADRISMWANVPHELAELVVEIAKKHKLQVSKVRSSSKTPDLVECRNEIAVKARALGYSLPLIGRAINRDHSTALYAINKAGDLSPSVLVDRQVEAA